MDSSDLARFQNRSRARPRTLDAKPRSGSTSEGLSAAYRVPESELGVTQQIRDEEQQPEFEDKDEPESGAK